MNVNQWEVDCIKWHGRLLTGKFSHYCSDWDELPVDETIDEFDCCHCTIQDTDGGLTTRVDRRGA